MTLDDLRLFAAVAAAGSFTAAGRRLGMPKQTLSRRIAELERSLGARLLHRTTRRLSLTEVGTVYAARCSEIVRLAGDANRAVADSPELPRGVLRVSADPVFGEAFVTGLIVEYARRWPQVTVEVQLSRRRVDLREEGFDAAFRIGAADDPSLGWVELGPARVRYCASPGYLARHGTPARPEALAAHACILVGAEAAPVRWPFRGRRGIRLLPVPARLTTSSFAMAHEAARAGLGIAIFPEFACAADLRRGRLRSLLDEFVVDVGAVWLVHPGERVMPARVRAFVELAQERLARQPWLALPRVR